MGTIFTFSPPLMIKWEARQELLLSHYSHVALFRCLLVSLASPPTTVLVLHTSRTLWCHSTRSVAANLVKRPWEGITEPNNIGYIHILYINTCFFSSLSQSINRRMVTYLACEECPSVNRNASWGSQLFLAVVVIKRWCFFFHHGLFCRSLVSCDFYDMNSKKPYQELLTRVHDTSTGQCVLLPDTLHC